MCRLPITTPCSIRLVPISPGRVLEALFAWATRETHPAVRRGVEYLLRTQEADGSWYGRWGVNYIYGTFLALRGLRPPARATAKPTSSARGSGCAPSRTSTAAGAKAAPATTSSFVAAPSTPSQTAWAILALLAGGDTTSSSLHNGIDYLVEPRRPDGTWDEDLATGTGFPQVFYLAYHLYRNSFPLLASFELPKAKIALNGATDKNEISAFA